MGPYYWDNDCEAGGLGCWADGIHAQCRFCGDFPYTGVTCPEGAAAPMAASCNFDNEPATPYYWEPGCSLGMHGCNADGENVHCRFCGQGDYVDIHCPGSHVCDFAVVPTVPYFWDPHCTVGMLGCKADGEPRVPVLRGASIRECDLSGSGCPTREHMPLAPAW